MFVNRSDDRLFYAKINKETTEIENTFEVVNDKFIQKYIKRNLTPAKYIENPPLFIRTKIKYQDESTPSEDKQDELIDKSLEIYERLCEILICFYKIHPKYAEAKLFIDLTDRSKDPGIVLIFPNIDHSYMDLIEEFLDNESYSIKHSTHSRKKSLYIYNSKYEFQFSLVPNNFKQNESGRYVKEVCLDLRTLIKEDEEISEEECISWFLSSKTERIYVCGHSENNILFSLLGIVKDTNYLKNFNNFMTVGKILYRFFDNGKYPKQIYKTWKSLNDSLTFEDHSPLTPEELKILLSSFSSDCFFTWKTLAYKIRKAFPKEYNEWHERWTREVFNIKDETDQKIITSLFYRFFFDQIICKTSAGGKDKFNWYVYEKGSGIWDNIGGFSRIIKFISEEFNKHINDMLKYSYKSDEYFSAHKEIWKKVIYVYCHRVNNVRRLRDALDILFLDLDPTDKFDNNDYLLNTNNCLIDFNFCDTLNPVFIKRDPLPEDFITKKISINYNESLDWNSPKVVLSMDFFSKLFVDEETREAVLRIFASFLIGGNKDKKFIVMTGIKDSGKSTLKKLILDRLLGNYDRGYSRDAPIESLLHSKGKNAGQASPELAQAKNSKVVTYTEPESDVKFGSSLIKRVSGGDTMYARQLFENGGPMKATFKMILQCNTIPKLKTMDKAALERFLIIPFNSVFVSKEKASSSEEEQIKLRRFPRDPDTIENRLNDYLEGVLWILMEYSIKYFRDGLLVSSEMENMIRDYHLENSPYFNFFQANMSQLEEDSNGFTENEITDKVLFNSYKIWYNSKYGSPIEKHVTSKEVFDEICEFINDENIPTINGKKVIIGYDINESNFNKSKN